MSPEDSSFIYKKEPQKIPGLLADEGKIDLGQRMSGI